MINYKEQVNDPRWVEKSREIMKRDNFTCQLCGKSHTKLNVHHIRYIKGKDYWDYPDELLMTVCEVCHQKIHGKYLNKRKIKHTVFYNCLFNDKRVKKTNDKIILSYICYKSVEGNDSFLVNIKSIAECLKMSCNTVYSSIKSLSDAKFISIKNKILHIYNFEELRNSYYFELLLDTGLKGEKLIVYSYLRNKSKDYNNIISTFDKKQAQEFGLSKKHYQKILCELYKDGLIERLNNGKLKIN